MAVRFLETIGILLVKSYSIKIILSVLLSTLVLVSVSTVLISSSLSHYKNTAELLTTLADQTSQTVEREVVAYITPAYKIAEFAMQAAESGRLNPVAKLKTQEFLRNSIAAAPQINIVALWTPDWAVTEIVKSKDSRISIIHETDIKYAEFKEFLEGVKLSQTIQWSPPFIERDIPVITVFAPLYHKSAFVGVIGIGISTEKLSSFVDFKDSESNQTSFVLYGKQHVLAHKNVKEASTQDFSDEYPLMEVRNIEDPIIEKIFESKVLNNSNSSGYSYRYIPVNGMRYSVFLRQNDELGDIPWYFGTYISSERLDAQILRFLGAIGLGILLILLSILAAIYIAHRITAPIRKLSEAADLVKELKFNDVQKIPPSWITELNKQAQAFNQMLDGLKWFSTYVPHKLVRQIAHDKTGDLTQSREEVLTVMFTDIVGFTERSEQMEAKEVAAMLNDQFELLNDCIEKTDGTLDKYIGDAIMAFWGAPESQQDHAIRACRAALLMVDQLDKQIYDLRIKIAIHSGPLIVGNIGAKSRMNYTVIGDTVNTCSRIEALGGSLIGLDQSIILVSEETANLVFGKFELYEIGSHIVKGRKNPVMIYRLLKEITK